MKDQRLTAIGDRCQFLYDGRSGPRGKVCGRPEEEHCASHPGALNAGSRCDHKTGAKVHHTFTRVFKCPTCGTRSVVDDPNMAEAVLDRIVARLDVHDEEVGAGGEKVEMAIDAIYAERDTFLAALRKASKLCSLCHGSGRYYPHCRFCDDSTFDHECPPKRDCALDTCVAIRALLADCDGTAVVEEVIA